MDVALQADECANFVGNIEHLFQRKQCHLLRYTYTSFGIKQLAKSIVINVGKARDLSFFTQFLFSRCMFLFLKKIVLHLKEYT